MLLTLADAAPNLFKSGVALAGPPGLATFLNALRTYVNVRDLGLRATELGAWASVL